MVQRCIVAKCGNIGLQDGVSLHSLPPDNKHDSSRRKLWIKFVQRKRVWTPPKNSKAPVLICSAHFTNDSFINYTKFQMGYSKMLKLKRTAVPTIYEPDPTHDTAHTSNVSRKREVSRVSFILQIKMNSF